MGKNIYLQKRDFITILVQASTIILISIFGTLIFISFLLTIVNVVSRVRTKREESKIEERILKKNEYFLLSSSGIMFIGIMGLVIILKNSWTGYRYFLDPTYLELFLVASWIILFWGFIFMKMGYRKTEIRIKRHEGSVEFKISIFGYLYIISALVILFVTIIIYFVEKNNLVYAG